MITLNASGSSVIFTFDGNSTYLNDGAITVPKNSLALIIDESDMATFRKAASNDIFVSANIAEFGMTKDELMAWYKANMVSSGGGGGGVTPEEVEEMINEAVSGKADSSDVYLKSETSGSTELATAFAGKQDQLIAGENITISGNVISAQGGGCEVEETIVYDRITGGYVDTSSKTKASFVILDYLGDKSTGSYQLAFVVGDTYNDYVNAYIYFDYPNHSSSSTDTGITEYLTVEYVNDIQDFKVTINPVYQSSVWIKQVYNVGFDMNLLVPFYTINSGSPCSVITTDVVGLIEKVKDIADESVNNAYFGSDKNVLTFNYGIIGGGGNSYYVNLKEMDGSNNTLKPNIQVGIGVSGWTEVNFSQGICDLSGNNVKGFTTFRISGDTTQVNNWNLNIAVGYNGNYSWDSVDWDYNENTFVLTVAWGDIFSAATATWDSNTGYLTVSYPETVTVDGEERQTEFYYINSRQCQYGYAITKLEYYAELQQPLKPYVQQLRTDVNTISGQVATKQDTLIAGSNITISGNVISATGGGGGSSYTAGDGIDITNDVISVTGKVDTSTYETYTAATATALASKQTTLTAGTGISIVDNVISATGGGGGGITSGEVQTMIESATTPIYQTIEDNEEVTAAAFNVLNEAVSGKADSSTVDTLSGTVTANTADIATVSGNVNTISGDVATNTSNIATVSAATAANTTALGGMKIVKLTESEYAALVTKDSNTLYVVIPDPQYRWTQSGTTCIGYDKYQNNIKEQSMDGGVTWTVVTPPEYSASTLIEVNSQDCGYIPPTVYTYSITIQGLVEGYAPTVSIDWGGEHTDTNLGNGTYTYTTSSESLSITVPDDVDGWHPDDYVNNFTLTSSNNSRTVTYTDDLG